MFNERDIEKAITVIENQKKHLKSMQNSLPLKAQLRTSYARDIDSLELAIIVLKDYNKTFQALIDEHMDFANTMKRFERLSK